MYRLWALYISRWDISGNWEIQAVVNYTMSRSVAEVRGFIGFANYYELVPYFVNLARPLHDLTKKNVRFVLNQQCKVAF